MTRHAYGDTAPTEPIRVVVYAADELTYVADREGRVPSSTDVLVDADGREYVPYPPAWEALPGDRASKTSKAAHDRFLQFKHDPKVKFLPGFTLMAYEMVGRKRHHTRRVYVHDAYVVSATILYSVEYERIICPECGHQWGENESHIGPHTCKGRKSYDGRGIRKKFSRLHTIKAGTILACSGFYARADQRWQAKTETENGA